MGNWHDLNAVAVVLGQTVSMDWLDTMWKRLDGGNVVMECKDMLDWQSD